MNKWIGRMVLVLILGSITATMFAGCKKQQEKVYDVPAADLAYELSQRLRFDDVIAEVDPQNVLSQYELEDVTITDVSGYMSSGATAEEIAVFVCNDKDSLTSVKEKCEQRLEKRAEVFAGYDPEEVDRLKNSYLDVRGNLVIFCVSNDPEEVDNIIKQFFGE